MSIENIFGISNFLPAYSYIDSDKNGDDNEFMFYANYIPEDYDKEFPISTYLKKEFNELKLAENEVKVQGKFKPMNHQLFMARFLSQYTHYDKILVFHDVGAGKSCLASLVVETAKAQNEKLYSALFLVKNDKLQKNITNEIATICTDGKYIPDPIDAKTGIPISTEQRVARLNKNIRQNYSIETYEKLAKQLKHLKDEFIKQTFSNRIIIIDEIHNIRPQYKKEDKLDIYNEIWRLLHLVENCKIMIMTATPIRDNPIEIANIMNLLLPYDKQFDVDTFIDDYFDKNDDSLAVKQDMRDDFKSKITGIVSYVRAMSSNVKKIYNGRVIKEFVIGKGVQHVLLQDCVMSKHQDKYYQEALTSEFEEKSENPEDEQEESGLYHLARNASMFVTPNGKYGKNIDQQWMIYKKDELPYPSSNLENYIKYGKHNPSVEEKKNMPDNDTMLGNLRNLSVKFAGVIEHIINNPREKAFVYSNLVTGCGALLFSSILQIFGFKHVDIPKKDIDTNDEKVMEHYKSKDKRQFLLITGDNFPTPKQTDLLVNKIYNYTGNKSKPGDVGNIYGDYIQVIIASNVASEGLSFKQSRQFHCLTPWWNNTVIYQAQGRVIRAFSHDVFPDNEKYIKIFKWCALPISKIESIDFKMYKISEDKDIPIKQVERMLKEVAVDCPFNRLRNIRPNDVDYTPECDYSLCDYKCDNIPDNFYEDNVELINDTYNLYYTDEVSSDVKTVIFELYKQKFMYDFVELLCKINEQINTTEIVLLKVLKDMIDKSIPIRNRYGIVSYLREYKNLYFLINHYEYKNNNNLYLLGTYNEQPILKEDKSFTDFITGISSKKKNNYYLNKLSSFADLNKQDIQSLRESFSIFDMNFQEELLELVVKANLINEGRIEGDKPKTSKNFIDSVLKAYKTYIVDIDTYIFSSLLYEYDKLRCFSIDENTWKDCTDEEIKIYRDYFSQIRDKFSKDNVYGYYGCLNERNEFRIASIRKFEPDEKVDIRKIGKGNVCGTGSRFDKFHIQVYLILFFLIAKHYDHPIPKIYDEEYDMSLVTKDKYDPTNVYNLIEEVNDKLEKKPLLDVTIPLETLEEVFGVDEIVRIPITLEELQGFSIDELKILYLYSIQTKMAGLTIKPLCDTLQKWFKEMNMFNDKVDIIKKSKKSVGAKRSRKPRKEK